MSSFSELKQQRSTKSSWSNPPSYVPVHLSSELSNDSQASKDIDQVQDVISVLQPGSINSVPYNFNGLYTSLPQDLEVRINTAGAKGRGIFSRIHRKPG